MRDTLSNLLRDDFAAFMIIHYEIQVLPHSWCRLISRKGDQVRDSKLVALSDQTWRGRLGAFSAETLYLTKFQLLAGLWRAELAARVRKNLNKERRHAAWSTFTR
jgi:hypothetical protein